MQSTITKDIFLCYPTEYSYIFSSMQELKGIHKFFVQKDNISIKK
jgi:hypothetical protein